MTAAVVDLIARKESERRAAAGVKPLYRRHEVFPDTLGVHTLELSSDMAGVVRSVAPQVENAWADQSPSPLVGPQELPPHVSLKNTLVVTGEALVGLGESLETAFYALMACADRLQDGHGDADLILEVRRDAAQVGEAMSLLYQYHLEQIEARYADFPV